MKISVVQPPYYAGENPDVKNAEFIMDKMRKTQENSLTVFPEYSNAGGLSSAEDILRALPAAGVILDEASRRAKENSAYIAVNVLERRNGELKNSTYLFDRSGNAAFVYDKIHLPPSEVKLGIKRGSGACVCDVDGIRFGFMTCYDVYFSEQTEFIAKQRPDIILVPGYQRGERTDIIRAQAKLLAFRCNAVVARSSFSMDSDDFGGCSMIVSSDGTVLKDIGKDVGSVFADVDPKEKYMRSAGFGGGKVRNDDFINDGLCSDIFKN